MDSFLLFYVIFSFVLISFTMLIWSTSDALNLLIKFTFFLCVVVGIIVLARNFLSSSITPSGVPLREPVGIQADAAVFAAD